jgi:hypothetical protein
MNLPNPNTATRAELIAFNTYLQSRLETALSETDACVAAEKAKEAALRSAKALIIDMADDFGVNGDYVDGVLLEIDKSMDL